MYRSRQCGGYQFEPREILKEGSMRGLSGGPLWGPSAERRVVPPKVVYQSPSWYPTHTPICLLLLYLYK